MKYNRAFFLDIVTIGSDALLLRYHERLRGNLALMSAADRVLCERVACLLPELDPEA